MTYDKSAKRYVAADDTMLGVLPPFDATPVPERAIDPFVLRAVVRAIREQAALDVLHQSMSRPGAARRIIEPHALAHDGFRWHARAFDRESATFHDFVLGRLSKSKAGGASHSAPQDDSEWQAFVALVIAPHPELTPAQSHAIAIDYGIRGRSITLRVRRALLFYALKRLGLDVADARPAHEQHIVLLNRAAVEAALSGHAET